MKAKTTLMSMMVSLFVFCLSLLFDIQGPSYVTEGNVSKTEDTLVVESGSLLSDPDETPQLQLFAYESDTIISFSDKINILPRDILELQTDPDTNQEGDRSSVDLKEQRDVSLDEVEDDLAYVMEESESTVLETTEDMKTISSYEEAEPEALYSHIGISIANSYVNIRVKADADSPVLGKLYRDSAAEIISTEGDWYLIESGSVKGYVNSSYIKTGLSDDDLIQNYGVLRMKVNVDGLNVREKPDTESDRLTVVYRNEVYSVINLQEEWLKVDISDDKVIGYIKREHADLIVDFKKAVSKEEEQEILKLQAEEKTKKETEIKYRDEVTYAKDDLKLLACLVHAEAGNQSYEGKLAVANIVLNRIKSKKYPSNMKSVIYQSGQFSVAASGSLAKQLNSYANYSSKSQLLTIKAARAALEGANNVGSRLYFHSYKSAVKKGYDKKSNSVKIDDHLFW